MKKLFHDYIIVEQKKEEKVGAIYIPTNEQEKSLIGTVLEIGKDIDDEDLKVGDVVYFDALNATPFEGNFIIQYQDIIGIK